MSEVFEVCQNNFYRNIREAQKTLKERQLSELRTKQIIEEINQVNQNLQQAQDQLKKMEMEYNLNQQFEMKNKIDLFKDQLKRYRRQLNAHQSKFKIEQQQKNGSLFEKSENNENGTDALIQAKRQMYQNQGIARDTAEKLYQNNEKLKKGINRMDDINNELTVAQKILGSIKLKLKKNKLILYGTMGFLILVVALIIYTYV